MKKYSGFFLTDGSHVTWDYQPGNCSLPDNIKVGDTVDVIVVGDYMDDEGYKAEIVHIIHPVLGLLDKQPRTGTVLHITRAVPEGGAAVQSGLRATKNGWTPLTKGSQRRYLAKAGFFYDSL